MFPKLMWNGINHVTVHSVHDLDHFLDRLTIDAQDELPFTVELQMSPDTGLSIVVGGEASHMEWFAETSRPPAVGCSGPWDSDDLIVFLHQGEYSELPKRFFIPHDQARDAMREYFQTGSRPRNVVWNDRHV